MSSVNPIKIDSEVFKIDTPLVSSLKNASISTDMFANSIKADDPFILIGNTIYALTPYEFYILQSSFDSVSFDSSFDYIINMKSYDIFSELDKNFILKVKNSFNSCPTCKKNHYKKEFYKLSKKYNLNIPIKTKSKFSHKKYPNTLSDVFCKVSYLIPKIISNNTPAIERSSCFDCVEKHIAQSYVLSEEFFLGYPEYITYICGHLGEAIDELPIECKALKETLEFCLSHTITERVPFVPVKMLIKLLNFHRFNINNSVSQQDLSNIDNNDNFDLDLTEEDASILYNIKGTDLCNIICCCYSLRDLSRKDPDLFTENDKITYEGLSASLSSFILTYSEHLANIVRNRRIMYTVLPNASVEYEHDYNDIIKLLLNHYP